VVIEWLHNGNMIGYHHQAIPYFSVSLQKPENGWDSGEYQIIVYINVREVLNHSFTVV
jgi:hypothetical protein